MNDTIVIPLLIFCIVLLIVITLIGFVLKPFIKNKIATIISSELNQRELVLKEITQPNIP